MQPALALTPRNRRDIIHSACRSVTRAIGDGVTITRALISECMTREAGGPDADGFWSMRDAYDVLELAQVAAVLGGEIAIDDDDPGTTLATLERLIGALPTQTYRSEAQIALQQFSTPLPIAWLAARAARLRGGEFVLEPSAGTGLLAGFAQRIAPTHVNEIDAARSDCLAAVFAPERRTRHDAELIDDLLDATCIPSVVLMNPPFSRSEGRGDDPHAADRHLRSALTRLGDHGRLVAIMPGWFGDSGRHAPAYRHLQAAGALHLDALLTGGLYAKHGTSIDVRLLVLDKGLPAVATARETVRSLRELLTAVDALPGRPARRALVWQRPVAVAASKAAPSLFGRKPVNGVPAPATAWSVQTSTTPVVYVPLEAPAPTGEQVGIYLPYRPSRLRFQYPVEHPTPLVESVAMGSISAPRPNYVPLLPSTGDGTRPLSDAQTETLVYAGAAFERDVPGTYRATKDGYDLEAAAHGHTYRMGFFLGDGTGAGKGRQVAGVFLDRWLRGERRHIWLSKNETLLEDARRDWSALGGLPGDIQPLSQWQLGAKISLSSGILFLTYPTLRSGRGDTTRLQQILQWATPDYDGVIAFDEAHAMANAAGGEGSRGKTKGSEQGIAGLRLQNLLPRARVLYVSATGASDVNNLAYASRLSLWGPETAFAKRDGFVESIRSGGIAAMELVARDLKALGLYTARALSFDGVEYDVLAHTLTPAQIRIYDAYADAWAIIHENLEAVLEATRVVDSASGDTLNSAARSAALSVFEGTKQRFFAQLLLSMKLPTLLPGIEADLDAGNSVVVQLVSTSEAMLDRRLADLDPDAREALDIDLSPREAVVDYLRTAFPVRQMTVFTDSEGNARSEPMIDEDGNPVLCRFAVAARDALVERLCALPPIGTALDTIIERFGTRQVAEVTGRSRRLVMTDGVQTLERRSARSNLVETDAFMRGEKRVLIFSGAGGTGRSYHASLDVPNQQRRIHYLLEPGWRADAAIQGLGRTHRTRQASAPLFRPVTTDCRGERRFISTIARRLDSLGALTRGQRQTGGQGMFDPADNLESEYAKAALLDWYRLLYAGKMQSVAFSDFEKRSGLRLVDKTSGGLRDDLPPIQRWLNRILALPIGLQNAIFDEYLALVEARVQAARDAGTLDVGVETIQTEDFRILSDEVIHTDAATGATTHLQAIEIRRRLRPMTSARVIAFYVDVHDALPIINAKSGRAALRRSGRRLMTSEGVAIARYELTRPLKRETVSCDSFGETHWAQASWEAFTAAWDAEVHEAQTEHHVEVLHVATGLLLPVWQHLGGSFVRVSRIVAADGRSVLGREIAVDYLAELARKLGLTSTVEVAPAVIADTVLTGGKPMALRSVDALTVKRAIVNGSPRVELTGFDADRLEWYKAKGCFTEIIQYRTRLFVPVERAAVILASLAPTNG